MSGVDWRALRAAAAAVRGRAHAPYSRFAVGAAILADGEIFVGCNVENASYPVGCCAERNALGAAVAAGRPAIEALVIVAARVSTPCGMCRQALVEFNPRLPVLLVGDEGERETDLAALLPDPFR